MKKSHSVVPKIAALSLLAACAAPAMAQTAGSNVVSVGWFHLTPQDSSSGLTKLNAPGAGNYPTRTSSVSQADTLGLALTHFFTDNIAVTADLGIPPKFKLNGTGDLGGLGELGTAKQWSPAIVAKYFFGDANSSLRPFIGAGVTYVWYSNVQLSRQFQRSAATGGSATVQSLGGDGTATASLSSSWSPVVSAGLSYNFDKNWSMGFSVSYIPVKTDADITANSNTTASTLLGSSQQRYSTSIKLHPIVTFLSVGYKF